MDRSTHHGTTPVRDVQFVLSFLTDTLHRHGSIVAGRLEGTVELRAGNPCLHVVAAEHRSEFFRGCQYLVAVGVESRG